MNNDNRNVKDMFFVHSFGAVAEIRKLHNID